MKQNFSKYFVIFNLAIVGLEIAKLKAYDSSASLLVILIIQVQSKFCLSNFNCLLKGRLKLCYTHTFINNIRQLFRTLRKSFFFFFTNEPNVICLKNPNVLWSTMFLINFASLNQLGNKLCEKYPVGDK